MKILWVDDEIDLLKSFVFFLEERNYDVDTCNNGNDAIEKVLENKYDMVILDEMGYLPFTQAGGALLFHCKRPAKSPC